MSFAFGAVLTLQQTTLDQVTGSIVNRSQAAVDGLFGLTKRHIAIVNLLTHATTGRFDEEQVYVAGATLLAELAEIEVVIDEFVELFSQSDREILLVRQIEQYLTSYKIAAASAIEMSTVDASLAKEELLVANNSYDKLYQTFLQLVDLAKSEMESALGELSVQSNLIQSRVMLTSILGVSAAIAICLAIYLSISRGLRALSSAMLTLADGVTDISIPKIMSKDELGNMAQSLVVFRSNAQDLHKAFDKERELNGLQRQFVSQVSHEFRTPLAIIDGLAQRLIKRGDKMSSDRRAGSLKQVREAVSRLVGLIESILSSASLEAGSITFNPVLMDLKGLVLKTCEGQQGISRNHKITMDIEALPDAYLGDPKLLYQAVTNLLSNAVKYSPDADRVDVTGRSTVDGLEITIRDFGVGIPKDELPKLSQRFFRASTSTGIQGTGIGLNLVTVFTEMHGGVMEVTSIEGEGSTFTVKLPHELPADNSIIAVA